MDDLVDHTLDAEGIDPRPSSSRDTGAHLIVLLECGRPLALSSRHWLGTGGSVRVGRGAARTASRRDDHRGVNLELRVPDRRMSSVHAELRGALGRWTVKDAGSKNGVRVNDQTVQEHALADGDVIELGHTFFLFRELRRDGEAPDLDLGEMTRPVPGLCTLVPDLAESYRKLVQLAQVDIPVLVLGETGTGKEVTARALHTLSRVSGPFVGVNCGAIPESLVEAELFGSVRGAFSGAVTDRPGLVRQAHRGTLFLDEIADLPLPSQAALLRVLQERRVRAVGAAESVPVELRVVSATNHDIEQRIRDGRFRQDLFARVGGYRIRLPPLRQRREDLGLLVGSLLPKVASESARRLSLSVAAGRRLLSYDFPLNVRELESWLAAAAALAEDDVIGLPHLPEPLELSEAEDPEDPEDEGRPLRQLTADQERHRDEVRALLREHRGNVSAVARASGKARNQVQRWLKRYALDPNDFR